MTETKRDVFEDTLDAYYDSMPHPNPGYDSPAKLLDRYKAALPDDLPVIPKAVGDILRSAHGQTNLLGVLDTAKNGYKISETLAWIMANQNTFARAWLDGVWRVDKTGEIVKLEAEK